MDKKETSKETFYAVKKGDSLNQIASNNKMTLKQLLELNKTIKSPYKISTGQKIKLS